LRRPVLVTGAAGFLGGEVLRCLRSSGTPSLGTWHEAPADGPRMDVTDAGAVDEVFRRVRPWAVVHTAYVQDGDRMEAVNASGSAHVAGAAARHGARLVHVSTDVVFDGTAEVPYTEDEPVSPVTPYGNSKAEAERLVTEAHPGVLVARTSLLYGAGGGPQEALVGRALTGEAIAFFSDEVRCPSHVSDLAAALVELTGEASSGILHVAGPQGSHPLRVRPPAGRGRRRRCGSDRPCGGGPALRAAGLLRARQHPCPDAPANAPARGGRGAVPAGGRRLHWLTWRPPIPLSVAPWAAFSHFAGSNARPRSRWAWSGLWLRPARSSG
jgi:dTDP-4-dehydrorhamnose reductase